MSRRNPISADFRILLAALIVLVSGAVISVVVQLGNPDGPPLSARAYGVTGGVALVRWYESQGYRVRLIEGRPFRLPDDLDVLFVLQPNARYNFTDDDRQETRRWVEDGGTLVVALQQVASYPITRRGPEQYARPDESLLEQFEIQTSLLESFVATATFQIDRSPGIAFNWQVASHDTPLALRTSADATTLASVNGQPVAVSRSVGRGRIIAFSTAYPFTNEGLRDRGNAGVALRLAELASSGRQIGFDEYHHGSRQSPSLLGWMLTTPAGLGAACVLALVAIYILWTGRRFGRPVSVPELRIRRQPSEYVIAMSNLARAAGQRDATLLRYRDVLKRRLGQPYRIDARLPDEQFVAELRAVGASTDGDRLLSLLRRLAVGANSAAQFARLAREASEIGA